MASMVNGAADSQPCPRCGAVLEGRRCKLQCPRCGYQEDCSDAGLIDYDRQARRRPEPIPRRDSSPYQPSSKK